MNQYRWTKEVNAAITVCDENGVIIEMNDRAIETFKNDGGAELIGRSLFDCHPEPARTKLREMMASRKTNCYTIEKNGVHKMIYQAPWYVSGVYRGLVEISFEIPASLPHFIRG